MQKKFISWNEIDFIQLIWFIKFCLFINSYKNEEVYTQSDHLYSQAVQHCLLDWCVYGALIKQQSKEEEKEEGKKKSRQSVRQWSHGWSSVYDRSVFTRDMWYGLLIYA